MDTFLPSPQPGLRFVGVPPEFRGHPLLKAGPYFTLPSDLLKQLVAQVDFQPDLLQMEYALSNVCGDHSSQIGFWGERPIIFPLLRPKNDYLDDFLVQGMAKWGKTVDEAKATLTLAKHRLNWVHDVLRGYCGWLMTNRVFLKEHRQVFEAWADQIAENGIPQMGPVVRDAKTIPGAELADEEIGPFLRAFEDFFIRWRLDGLPAPFVPQPMGVHLPVVDLRPVLGHMRQGGTTFYIPDICPIPSRDDLREVLEEALRRREAPDYLAEWFEIVQSDNVAKNQIPRYARVFEVQHYLQALYARHAAALKRKKSALGIAISTFLGVSEDTIERDVSFIADRLGSGWYLPSA